MIAEIDMSPFASVGLGGLLLCLCGWYWQHLGKLGTAPSRRAIRRGSLVLAVLAIFAMVHAASFVDAEVDPANYVNSWLAAIGLLFLFMLLVGVDLLNSFLIYRRLLARDMLLDAQRIQSLITSKQDAAERRKHDEDTH